MRALAALGVAFVLIYARPAPAFEFFDGRLQIHGFGETIARTISSDFDDDWDLTQWQFLLNLELELDIAPDGIGPFNAVSAFSRVEVRYDCVWRRACGLASSADAYGDRANQGAFYFTNGESSPFTGTAFGNPTSRRLQSGGRYISVAELDQFATLFDLKGPDQIRGSADDPAPLVFGKFADYTVTTRRVRGGLNGRATQVFGPWKPKEDVTAVGALRDVPNALSPLEASLSTGTPFTGPSKPFRPFPFFSVETAEEIGLPLTEARGVYYPSEGLARTLKDDDLRPFDVNFRQRELEFNRGASQQDEKELKELYLDVELFDGRLWLRLGKQTIVWGKTELFRSQDQFNPQDISLSSLPGLEESRIALWAARAVWSFYDVGPLEDVRLELAAILDDFEPIDIGRCGEPYAPFVACLKSIGLFFHGLTGLGLAGEQRPQAWWNDTSGLEFGARLEFRWRRFSFALTDYYGYSDIPYADPIFKYDRNVDPRTGRPRIAGTSLGCDPERLFDGDKSSCLGNPRGERLEDLPSNLVPAPGRIPEARDRFLSEKDEILRRHHANQSLFHVFCAATIGFSDLLPGLENECVFNIFGSQSLIDLSSVGFGSIQIAETTGQLLAGSNTLLTLVQASGLLGEELSSLPALLPLNTLDPRTGEGRAESTLKLGGFINVLAIGNFASSLTPEQQALLGCGDFYGTSCDTNGLDLMNAEAGALLQSVAGFDGTPISGFTTLSGPQPGTLGFEGGQPCARFERGRQFILPGCRGPEDPGYHPDVDGVPVFALRALDGLTTSLPFTDLQEFDRLGSTQRALAGVPQCEPVTGRVLAGEIVRFYHPFTCAPFRSEMAALSYNLMMIGVLISTDTDDDGFENPEDFDELDPSRPFDPDRCSFAAPQFCSVIRALIGASGVGRNDVRAAGNGRFGRRDFLWHNGQELVLRYAKRNVLGFSMDFAEDWSKTNWSIEATWFDEVPVADRNANDNNSLADSYNLTISMDRPTFINFLNANRTFLFNTQLFINYSPDHTPAFSANGPWNFLGTFTVVTGYFQDRLFSVLTLVYDVQSNSGAGLPSLSFRFTESFSVQFGMAVFFGRFQQRRPFLMAPLAGNRVGRHGYKDFVENGLALIRDRDEAFLRLRWTF